MTKELLQNIRNDIGYFSEVILGIPLNEYHIEAINKITDINQKEVK